jgi:ribose-phosphate pyrophosphokinase
MSNVYADENLKLFTLNSNKALAEEIAKVIGV